MNVPNDDKIDKESRKWTGFERRIAERRAKAELNKFLWSKSEQEKQERKIKMTTEKTELTCPFHEDTCADIDSVNRKTDSKMSTMAMALVLTVLVAYIGVMTDLNVRAQDKNHTKLDKLVDAVAQLDRKVVDSERMMKARQKLFETYQKLVLRKLNIPVPLYDSYYELSERSNKEPNPIEDPEDEDEKKN